ncbi:amidase [Microlunatus soli]|uniref:Aspartyl-tRNA(Asn)/glutamyl-tRNA(Gln) amidotransferase subunit A n=1 Tax=Microlunatus soli TaxID=630515 RepID=A0A1H2AK87_9ACTN|nr:amidase family protein [Microlunatus soli]SDT45936.1 aspartyl-tRNA(Asn)/glutamyl-tRNA(Gln) amidotransferase subunit A [Microlunatus soli]
MTIIAGRSDGSDDAADELCWLSVRELRDGYATRRLSPVEVTEALLQRIERLDGDINAFVTVTADRARADAKTAEQQWARNPDDAPPMLGIPFAIKDLVPTAGIRTTKGSRLTRDWIPEQNSPLADRLLGSGGVMMGKTTTSEVGWKAAAGNRVNGPAHNPHNLARTAGGSSGGAAAAVAAGFAPVAQGGDGAGSVRIPAAFCGVVGIKPGPGLIPYYPPTPLSSIVANGTLARSVDDAAALLDLISTADPRDPTSMLRDHRPVAPRRDERASSPLRIAYCPTWGGRPAEPEITAALDLTAERLGAAGHRVELCDDTPRDRFDLLHVIWTTGFAAILSGADQSELDPGLAAVIEAAGAFSGADLAAAHLERQEYKAEVSSFLAPYDLILTPSCAVTAFPVGQDGPDSVNEEPADYLDWAWFSYAFNLSEHPAISIPVHGPSLPIGAQLVAAHGAEARLIRAARTIEDDLS